MEAFIQFFSQFLIHSVTLQFFIGTSSSPAARQLTRHFVPIQFCLYQYREYIHMSKPQQHNDPTFHCSAQYKPLTHKGRQPNQRFSNFTPTKNVSLV